VSKHWKPRKKSVELQSEPRPSRIRREPVRAADPRGAKTAYWRSVEWDRRFAVTGIVVFALAIFVAILGFSAIFGGFSFGDDPARATRFGSCDNEGGANCVIDGDTIRIAGVRTEIAGLSAPSIETPGCPEEQQRGIEAANRLIQILNSGKVTSIDAREADGQWRRKVEVDGQDVAATMIGAHVARAYRGGHINWCS
jgi:endonuclease YncB( thermonuclease family)